jgi:hypothetical protein
LAIELREYVLDGADADHAFSPDVHDEVLHQAFFMVVGDKCLGEDGEVLEGL